MPAQAPAPPSDDFAIAGPSTENGAASMTTSPAVHTPVQSHVRERNSDQPSRRSRRNDCTSRRTCAGTRNAASAAALMPKVAASAASAQPAPAVATSTPATAGPAIPPAPAETPRSTLACWRWCGATIAGVSPVTAG